MQLRLVMAASRMTPYLRHSVAGTLQLSHELDFADEQGAASKYRRGGRIVAVSCPAVSICSGARFPAQLLFWSARLRFNGGPDGCRRRSSAGDGIRANCRYSAAVWACTPPL